jgi:hypothetical protein
MKNKKQRKQQSKTSKPTDIGDGEDAGELSNVQDNGGEQQQANDQQKVKKVGCFFRNTYWYSTQFRGYFVDSCS